MTVVTPYQTEHTKKQQVEQMFDNISHRYDLLNHLLSLQIDKRWRSTLVKSAKQRNPNTILDVATGTGDLAIALAKNIPAKITGYDLSQRMLNVGIEKVKKLNLSHQINMVKGDAENIPFQDNNFDLISVAFGVRNFENLKIGLVEMKRVLKENGALYILEFSKPEGFFAPIFRFYFKNILPTIGKILSKDSRAYTYLPESVEAFPSGDSMKNILQEVGYKNVSYKKLTLGIATIYIAIK